MSRLKTLAGWLLLMAIADTAVAVPPPRLPLPACEEVDGERQGACLDNTYLTLNAGGRIAFNATTDVYRDADVPPCEHWNIPSDTWRPSPCWSHVEEVRVVGCAWIDIVSGSFVEGSCGSLIAGGAFSFDQQRPEGGSCAGSGDFETFSWGGPSSQPGARWIERAEGYVPCEMLYTGARIERLRGATWARVRSAIRIRESGSDGRARTVTGEGYVPVDGDLIDLGPVAGFDAEVEGGLAIFENRSVHTTGDAMTYEWDFGDGATSTAKDPTHVYEAPGRYRVRLTATDPDGDTSTYTGRVVVDFALLVAASVAPGDKRVGEAFEVSVEVRNPFDRNVEDFGLVGAHGLRFDPDRWMIVSGPTPEAPTTIGAGENLAFTWQVEPLASGRGTLTAGAFGRLGALVVAGEDAIDVSVAGRLDVKLSAAVTAETEVGDTFEVVATLTNEGDTELTGLETDALEVRPASMLTRVSGPVGPGGVDPRVSPLSLAPGASTTISWQYRADERGVATLAASVSGRDAQGGGLFFVSAETRIAIESAALDISLVRLSPGSPIPGDTGTVRVTLKNIGSVDLTNLDFDLAGSPEVKVVERVLAELSPEVHPRIPLLAPDEGREVLIPMMMALEVGGLATYTVEVEMRADAVVDGEPVEVNSNLATTKSALDLTEYWPNLLESMWKLFLEGSMEVVEGLNEWGESSTLGGVTVGCGEGALAAFQKMGDGILTATDVLGTASGGGYTEEGKLILAAINEYVHTTSYKQIAKDFASLPYDLGFAAGAEAATWMGEVVTAWKAGDERKVAALLTEPATSLGVGVGVEQATARVFTKIMGSKLTRETMHVLMKEPSPVDEATGLLPYDRIARRELDNLKEMPTGVAISGETVARAGLKPDEHAWMAEMGREHGVAFFVRPRPPHALEFANRGFNAKPVPVKFKSVNEIDQEWLGYPSQVDLGVDGFVDEVNTQGLVVMRKPKDPYPAMYEAVERGELEWGGEEIDEIIKRYHKRRAEWELVEAELEKLNADGGFEILRYGRKIKTQAYLDGQGLLRFTHDNQPVFSDIDLLHIARPDGSPIPKELHDVITNAGRVGLDTQHGDTLATSDFPSWEKARDFAVEYSDEHKRGGDPLIIVQGDVTTLGYVESIELPTETPTGSFGDLYGLIRASYEGAQSCPAR